MFTAWILFLVFTEGVFCTEYFPLIKTTNVACISERFVLQLFRVLDACRSPDTNNVAGNQAPSAFMGDYYIRTCMAKRQ